MRRPCLVLSIALLVASAACRGEFAVDPPVARATPLAHAGTGSRVLVGSSVEVDGRGSYDPDGELSSYFWTLAAKPATSKAALADVNVPMTSLVLDAVGGYELQLRVTDDDGLVDTSWVTMVAEAPRITVNAGADAATQWRTTVQLAGSYAVEGGVPATVSWSFASQPPGSTATITNANTLTPSFVPDAEGTFVARLTVTTAHGMANDEVSIEVSVPRQSLLYDIVDAEYSSALDRFVIVSRNPAQLHIHDPATNTETVVSLSLVPKHVSVSPDGLRAAVAHDGVVTIVNLQTTAQASHVVNVYMSDLVFGADNRVHVFAEGQWVNLYTLAVASGTVSTQTGGYAGGQIHGGMRGRLHPSGQRMYGVDTGLSPSDLHRFDVSTAPVAYVRDSPYHGTYTISAGPWFSQDGGSIFTRVGPVFTSTSDPMTDMTYRGTLAPLSPSNFPAHQWIVHSSTTGKIITGTHEEGSTPVNSVRVYDAQTLQLEKVTPIPRTRVNNAYFESDPLLVTYRSDLSKIYVLANTHTGVSAIYEVEP